MIIFNYEKLTQKTHNDIMTVTLHTSSNEL